MALLHVWMLQDSPALQPNGSSLGSCSPTKSHFYRNDQESPSLLPFARTLQGAWALGMVPRTYTTQRDPEWARMWPELTQHDGWPPSWSLTPRCSQLLSPPAPAPCPNLLPPTLLSHPPLPSCLALAKARNMISE